MRSILFHGDNLPQALEDVFDTSESFSVPQSVIMTDNYSMDKMIHETIGDCLIGDTYDLIVLPYAFSDSDYLELAGLRIAAHIRLTPEWNHQMIPIMFIGVMGPEVIGRLSPLANILFTSCTYHTQGYNSEKVRSEVERIGIKRLSDDQFNGFLSRMNIQAPANYDTHHSVVNELALLRWSQYLGCEGQLKKVVDKLTTGLYFKWYNAKKTIESVTPGNLAKFKENGRVLLIDDESGKGWHTFYEHFFSLSSGIEFESLSTDYNQEQKQIIEDAIKKVEGFDPEVVLLDLRLCGIDFRSDKKTEQLTGYILLERIKALNRGIQVIVTTASNKVWNSQILLDAGATTYIVKSGELPLAKSIDNLEKIISSTLSQAAFLKPVSNKFDELIKLINVNIPFEEPFKKAARRNLDVSFYLLRDSFNDSEFRNYAYLQLFLIIEEYLNLESVFITGDESYVKTTTNKYLVLRRSNNAQTVYDSAIEFAGGHYKIHSGKYSNRYIDVNFKMSSLLLFVYGLNTSGEKEWTKVYGLRNDISHRGTFATNDDVFMIIDFILFIMNYENHMPVDKEKALKEISMEDKMKSLKEKFNTRG